MTQQTAKVRLGERALLVRVNRALSRHNGQAVKKCRADTSSYRNLGDYYAIDPRLNAVVETHVNLEALARKMGVIKPHEELATLDELNAEVERAAQGLHDRSVSPRELAGHVRAWQKEQEPGSENSKRGAAMVKLANTMAHLDKVQAEYRKLRRENPQMPRITLLEDSEGGAT